MYGEKCFREPKVLKAASPRRPWRNNEHMHTMQVPPSSERAEYEINIMAMEAGKWPQNGEEERRTGAECMLHASGEEEWRTKLL